MQQHTDSRRVKVSESALGLTGEVFILFGRRVMREVRRINDGRVFYRYSADMNTPNEFQSSWSPDETSVFHQILSHLGITI